MKKALLALALMAIGAASKAQVCTPNASINDSVPGIYPAVLPEALEGQPYEATITIKTTCDTSLLFNNIPVTLSIKAFKILDVVGEPAGFDFQPNAEPWTNPEPCAPILGCVKVTATADEVTAAVGGGTPAGSGIYPITVYVDVLVTGNPIPTTPTWASTLGTPPYGSAIAFSDYFIKVNPLNATIEQAPTDRFWVGANYPNPFTGATTIRYNTVKEEDITLKVYNTLGSLVSQINSRSQKGTNNLVFDATKLSAGVYIYTLSNGKESYTRKLTVN